MSATLKIRYSGGNRNNILTFGSPRDDETTGQALVLYHLVTQEFSQSLCCTDGGGFLGTVLFQRARHTPVLGNQLE